MSPRKKAKKLPLASLDPFPSHLIEEKEHLREHRDSRQLWDSASLLPSPSETSKTGKKPCSHSHDVSPSESPTLQHPYMPATNTRNSELG